MNEESPGVYFMGECLDCGHDVVKINDNLWHADWLRLDFEGRHKVRLVWTVCRVHGCVCADPRIVVKPDSVGAGLIATKRQKPNFNPTTSMSVKKSSASRWR